jgi:glycosyltransferase involved in cell wall biosynthesis
MDGDYTEVSDGGRLHRDPLVSVLMITYRHEAYLAQAVESVAAQKTDFPFEIVIAEDCSPDRTREVALEMQRKYPELVRVAFPAKNRGAQHNARFGIGLCRGKYIASCEGDDFWIDEQKLARQVAALERLPGVDFAFTGGYRYYSDGSQDRYWDYGDQPRIIGVWELFATARWVAPSPSLFWRADVLKNTPAWFAEAPFGDVFLMLAGSARGGAYYDPRPTVCYRMAHPTSFTVAHAQSAPEQRADYMRRSIHYLHRACDHYNIPRGVLSDRINDYRIELARSQRAMGNVLAAALALFRLEPRFVLRKLRKRLFGRP